MSTNHRIHLVDIPVGGNGGAIWHRLHEEREDICAAMLKDYHPAPSVGGDHQEPSEVERKTQYWHLELLQARLRRIDAALDRLMSGSYGICARCAHPIETSELDFDPANGNCSECRKLNRPQSSAAADADKQMPSECDEAAVSEMSLESLSEFDTLLLQTDNSHYRLLLLDPKNGRALAQGGKFLSEPQEVFVTGSRRNGSMFKVGLITVGSQLEMWLGDQIIVTSPIRSVQIEDSAACASLDSIMIADQIV